MGVTVPGNHQRDPGAEHRESRRPDRRRTDSHGQQFTYAVRSQGRLETAEQFENIVLRGSPGGAILRVKDVARVELGAQNYNMMARLNGKPAALIALYQLPDSNAVDAANGAQTGHGKTQGELSARP